MENVLAARYATPEMVELWDPITKIRLERQLWVTVLEAQRDLGLEVAENVIDDYRGAVTKVDLTSIASRERELRHDVKARIDEFNAVAGHESIHLGMTSRDLTENVEQLQVHTALDLVLVRAVAALDSMARLAVEHAALPVTGRTHNVPAQVTTVGKRIAAAGEELSVAVERVDELLARYPLRGIKGPVGTQQDQIELLGDADAAHRLDQAVTRALGFERTWGAVGQVYPRSLDLDVVAALVQLAAGPADLATTLRLMAGHDLATEGFGEGQVGSSAMPHKMNARTSERIHGFKVVLGGHLAMAVGLSGEQWNEGDVSCSIVRRVMLPDAFFAVDGMFASLLTVLDELGFHPAVIERELAENLPFLATTKLLVAAVQAGAGREHAHDAIRRHAVAAARARRDDPGGTSAMLDALAEDPDFPLAGADIERAVGAPLDFTGAAVSQVQEFAQRVAEVVARHPGAAGYRPPAIL